MAVIPARSGSKGLPNKNILDCAGKPLIAWTIEAAISVAALDEVIVSTDTEQIAKLARACGATAPFLRPPSLATDSASIVDVVKHAWHALKDKDGKPFDYVVVLQPTSPLRTKLHIAQAIDQYFATRSTQDDTLASVYPVSEKFGWLMKKTSESSSYVDFCFEFPRINARRQGLGSYYMPNGAVFIVRGETLDQGFYTDRTIPFVMALDDSIDIDTLEDFNQATDLLRTRLEG